MWGGKREGAGRKPIETVRIRVPVGVLDQVNEVIRAYKAGLLKADPEIKILKPDPEIKVLKVDPEIKELKSDPEIKVLKGDPEIKAARLRLEQLKGPTKKTVIKSFGTCYNAAKLGVRVQPDGGLYVPNHLHGRLKTASAYEIKT